MGVISIYLSEEQHDKWIQICKSGQCSQSKMFQRIVEDIYQSNQSAKGRSQIVSLDSGGKE